MADEVLDTKAHFVGVWKGNVVSDNIIQHLRHRSETGRGKKVKIRLSKHGIQIKKYALFQGASFFDSYRMEDIFFVTVNQGNRSCLLCIVRDPEIKYSILAFRCASDRDAGQFVQTFKSLKRRGKGENYEMTRSETGNWTLRSRSGASTRHYLTQVKPVNGAPNGDIRHYHHSHVKDVILPSDSDAVVKEEMYLKGKKQTNIGVQTSSHDVDIDQISEASDVSAFKDELESLSQELREIKYLLEKSTGISAEEHYRRARESARLVENNNYEIHKVSSHTNEDGVARAYISHKPETSSQVVQRYSSTNDEVFAGDHDFRSYGVQTIPATHIGHPRIKSSEVASVLRREFSTSYVEDKSPRVMAVPASHKTLTGSQTNGVVEGHVTGRETVRVKTDPVAVRVANDRKTRSMRLSSDFMVPSTIEKSIEKTYARPTILKSGFIYDTTHRHHTVRKQRPQSVYLMSGVQPVKVHNPRVAYEATF